MLIEGELIVDVVKVDPSIEVEDLICEYIDWNPIDFEHMYVSPGMIDFNIRRHPQWESLEDLTRAAVAGGVTLCIEETTPTESRNIDPSPRYCDTAFLTVLDSTHSESLTPESLSTTFALKGYLTPPSDTIDGLCNLPQWFQHIAEFGLPIILDCSITEPKVLFLASPCRLESLERRKETQTFADQKMFGGAFCSEADSEDSDDSMDQEDNLDLPSPASWKQQFHAEEAAFTRKLSMKQSQPPKQPDQQGFKRNEPRLQTLGHIPDFAQGRRSLKNIHTALEAKIDEESENLESLCKAEMMAYQGIGQTTYKAAIETGTIGGPQVPQSTGKVRKRPTPLTMVSAPARVADAVYLKQLAHYPDHMETRGLKMILNALKISPCRVHISNLSTAKAISLIQKAKEEKVEITCETCPHFLYFTDQQIADGDTRFKNFPPVRNKSNCNFLWELLKLNSIDVVCSQHSAVSDEYKFKPSFKKAVSGITCMGYTLQVVWTLLKSPITDLNACEHYLVRLAKWTAKTPAEILKISNRGSIEKGCLADLIIWNPFQERTSPLPSQAQCPYNEARLLGHISKVFVRGKVAFSDGNLYPVGCAQSRPST